MPLEPGQIVDRYEVQRALGEGGMAAVYLVRHTALGSLHALKVLTLDRPGLRERLLQEGRVQAALKHDCAVTVTDVIDVGGAPGLILEYVDGPTLDVWIATDPSRPARLEVFRQIVQAMAAAHEMGLVHRDLKPGNVLLEMRPEGPRAKVTDFGIAKALSEGEQGGQTRAGTTMGTPAYMAPEQMKDASTVDHRADVWALGAILYELMTGEVAMGQGTLVETWDRAKTADYPDPATRVPDLDHRVAAAIRGALEPDLDRRVASCEALLEMLDSRTAPLPPPGVESLAPQMASRSAGAGRWPMVAILAVGGGVALGAVGLLALLLALLGRGGEPEPCEPGWVGTVGYARASGLFRWGEGDEWRLPRRIDVYRAVQTDPEDEAEPVCFLPAGTTVTLVEPPQKAGGRTWVRIGARGFELPPPPE